MSNKVVIVTRDARGLMTGMLECSADDAVVTRLQEVEHELATEREQRSLGEQARLLEETRLRADNRALREATAGVAKLLPTFTTLADKLCEIASRDAYQRGLEAARYIPPPVPRRESRHQRALRNEREYRRALSEAVRNAP